MISIDQKESHLCVFGLTNQMKIVFNRPSWCMNSIFNLPLAKTESNRFKSSLNNCFCSLFPSLPALTRFCFREAHFPTASTSQGLGET